MDKRNANSQAPAHKKLFSPKISSVSLFIGAILACLDQDPLAQLKSGSNPDTKH
jgi:hypothetical protein